MKQYIFKFLTISILFCGILTCFIGYRIYIAKQIDWKLPNDTHILFLGASHSYRGIDAKLIDGAVNLSHPSERYMYTYIKLKKYFESNANIDTIFLECSSTDLWQNTDYKYYAANEQSFFVTAYWPLFSEEEWSIFENCKLEVASLVLSHLCDFQWYKSARYAKFLGTQADENNTQKLDTSTVRKDLEINKIPKYGYYGYHINYHYLRKIINYCYNHDVKLYLVGYPIYKESYFYDTHFCDSMRNLMFEDVDYLDFRILELPPEYRYDAHHLNKQGAKVLTKIIKEKFFNKSLYE